MNKTIRINATDKVLINMKQTCNTLSRTKKKFIQIYKDSFRHVFKSYNKKFKSQVKQSNKILSNNNNIYYRGYLRISMEPQIRFSKIIQSNKKILSKKLIILLEKKFYQQNIFLKLLINLLNKIY